MGVTFKIETYSITTFYNDSSKKHRDKHVGCSCKINIIFNLILTSK